jgi:hypothetical protein
MKRRRLLLIFGGTILAGGGILAGGFFSRDISKRFCIEQPVDELPVSIKIIVADLTAGEVCVLKSAVPLQVGFGMVEVNGYLVPALDWAIFTLS